MAKEFPEVAERLKRYLADGKVELIGGSYGQPLGTMFSGESNIRQIAVGRETIRKALGYATYYIDPAESTLSEGLPLNGWLAPKVPATHSRTSAGPEGATAPSEASSGFWS